MHNDELKIDRDKLRLGKYTSQYAELTSDQLNALLWLLGEYTIRADRDGSLIGNKPRAQMALIQLVEFHKNPLTLKEVFEIMQKTAKR